MRLLILGGTRFLGRAIAAHACSRGHDVTCAARGQAGAAPDRARFIHVDRDHPDGLAPLERESFDAVVDVSRHPGQVRRAVKALKHRAAHWSFVSTVTVYADNRTVGQRADTAPLKAPTAPEVEHCTEETYGAAKVACEQAVGGDAFICRAGLIAGPEDPTGRFTYWPVRLARGGEVLVPGMLDDAVQLIEVRDLAQWIVLATERSLTGTFDEIGPSFTRGAFLTQIAAAVGASCTFTWADRAFLERHDIKRWSGPRSLPLWLPLPEFAGFSTRDTSPARDAGLTVRPLAETARDTLAWARASGGAVIGLTADEETAALRAWHASR
jgi:nucleoside-diphosphate-sugar epimerase